MKDVVEFTANVPVEVALAYGQGKIVESRFGNRVMYSTTDDRVMFLDLEVAQKINELGLKARQPMCICKHQSGKKGVPAEWRVWPLDAEVGEQSNGTFKAPTGASVVRTPAPALVATPSTVPPPSNHNGNNHSTPPANGNGNGAPPFASEQPSQIHLGWAQFLLSSTNALTDVYAAALAYASARHGNAVKAEDVRALLTTAYIAQTKGGGPSHA